MSYVCEDGRMVAQEQHSLRRSFTLDTGMVVVKGTGQHVAKSFNTAQQAI